MHIRTMAVQINEKTWPVAVACLGGRFASLPFPEVEGAFLVINTPDQLSGRARPYSRVRTPYSDRDNVSLGNVWLLEEDFRAMYKFDGRRNTETFFEVVKIDNKPVPKETADAFEKKLQELNETFYGQQQDTDAQWRRRVLEEED